MVATNFRLYAEALSHALARHDGIDVVHHGAIGGRDAVEVFRRKRPDVAILDYVMAGLDGPAATEAIRSAVPGAKVLLLSAIHGPDHVERALASGVVGFLPKSLSVVQVVEAVRQAHSGRPLVYADQLATLVDGLNKRIQIGDELSARSATLTERELEILRQLGDGKTTREVARSLAISAGTVKNQLTRIFAKTGARTRMEAVDAARGANQHTLDVSSSAELRPTPFGSRDVQIGRPSEPMVPVTVAVAHGQRLMAESLAGALEEYDGLDVSGGWSVTGRGLVADVARRKPDVALVDFWISDLPGPAATRAALRLSPATRVAFLAEYFMGPIQRRQASESGALWVLSRDLNLGQVVDAILAAAATPVQTAAVSDAPVADRLRRLMTLTTREIEVLQILRQGLSLQETADELSISRGTVKNHLHSIMVKTEAQSQLEVLLMAEESGFITGP